MFSESQGNPHDFVNDFVELPLQGDGLHFEHQDHQAEHHLDHQLEDHLDSQFSNVPKGNNVNLQELFYSPMLSAAPGSAEPTPLMTPNDHSFAMPPSYFSPSLSPGLPQGEMPEFELPKKAVATPSGSRVAKQKSIRRKWTQSRSNSTASRHNSTTASPSDEDQQQLPQHQQQQRHGSSSGAVTPASLMNVSLLPQDQQNSEVEFRLNEALLATQQIDNSRNSRERRFSVTSQSSTSSAMTPAIRPRRAMQSSATSSPAIAPYLSPAIAPSDADALLASKSNYQNIIEGKHQQLGLQYPERLAADITSKKASHKIAEQERRNRINVAITELGRLVTPDVQMTSKAATVEAAIDYIKGLHEEIRVLKERLA